MYSPLIFVPFGSYIFKLIHWKAWRNGQSTINNIIRERRQAADNKKGKTRVDILDLLLSDEEGRQLTDNEIKEQLFQIFGAGFDTTANALGWFFYLITTHKQYQQKIMDEIDLLPDLSRENLDKLAFTQQCIQETLRLYPPAINISRQTEEGITLPCGLKVPANTHIEVAPLLMHRNPEYWQDPLEFRPERFAPGGEASQPKAKDAFVPFSLGPRSCIGKVFFYHEARMIIAHALKQFSFDLVEHPDNGVMISNEGLMKPRAVWVKVHRRRT
ncbi:cytochrome P450 [Paraphysoderma sedebokerense]|nr:cytochrome P450 [Paraphysoderma sedebokerense]